MSYQFIGADAKTSQNLREIASMIPAGGDKCMRVELVKTEKNLSASWDGQKGVIGYHRPCELYRAFGLFTEHVHTGSQFFLEEKPAYGMLCFMVDNSRNAVLNMDSAKHLIRILALMGYNALMFYTEDTYEVEGHPYFGYMRGRFSISELQKLDAYAAGFGIELIPCIQTLAHLNAALRWNAFQNVYDCADILLAGEEKTYALIDDMLSSISKAFSSRKINIGMDEAELLGAGKYLAKNGFRDRSSIMLAHLQRVVRLCSSHGFHPMMWSDMFFKLAGNGDYYGIEGSIPEQVIAKVPQEISLIYWDYFQHSEAEYEHMLSLHQNFRNPVIFAGGATKWLGFAPCNQFSFKASRTALEACRNKKIDRVILTTWGDNGAECSLFAIMPVMQLYAESCYEGNVTEDHIAKRLFACTGANLEDFQSLDLPNLVGSASENPCSVNPSKYLFYQDVLCGLFDRHVLSGQYNTFFSNASRTLSEAAERNGEWAYIFRTLSVLSKALSLKCDLGVRLKKAYDEGSRTALRQIADRELPELIRTVKAFAELYRKQWYRENRAFGIEVIQIRLGGVQARLNEAAVRIHEYLDGKIDRIEELEVQRLFYDCRNDAGTQLELEENNWSHIVTAGTI